MRLEMRMLHAVGLVNAVMARGGRGEACIGIAGLPVDFRHQVPLRRADARFRALVVEPGRAGRHRRGGIEHGGKRLVVDFDERARQRGQHFAFGHDRGDALPHKAHDAIEHHRVVGIGAEILVPRGAEVERRRVLEGQHRMDAGRGERLVRADRADAGMRDRRAHELHMQQPRRRDVGGVERRAGDDAGTRGRRQAAAARGARRIVLDEARAGQRIPDGAVAGTAAEIALHRPRQVARLRRIERRSGQDHSGRAEAALEPLGVEKGLLQRMEGPARQPLDRGDGAARRAKRRDDAAMNRNAVEQHRTGSAIAGVAPGLDAEPAERAQEAAQALAGGRGLGEALAVHGERHSPVPSASSRRTSSASAKVKRRR